MSSTPNCIQIFAVPTPNSTRVVIQKKILEEKKETKKITSFKEITPEIQQSLAYFQNRRPSKEELEKLSEQTGIFWLTIRVSKMGKLNKQNF